MKLQMAPANTPEETYSLNEVSPGQVIRWSNTTFEQAFETREFWLRLNMSPTGIRDHIMVANLNDGRVTHAPGGARVHVVQTQTLLVDPMKQQSSK